MEEQGIDLLPSPASLIESLRSIGYSLDTALADIIDNSISAEATKIDVDFRWAEAKPWIAITDNGYGMCRNTLINAMRFGSFDPLAQRERQDMGRFGLGMKTASLSQCRNLIVLSKNNNQVSCFEWNLDLICDKESWLIFELSKDKIEQNTILNQLYTDYISENTSGTIVLWQNIDRLDDKATKEIQESAFNELLSKSREHLELIFHRFLSPDSGSKKIIIEMNNLKLEAFNPFNTSSLAKIEMTEEVLIYDGEEIKVQPYILPHHNNVTAEEYKKYAGTDGYLHNQGFYVYRNRRLIIKGTWFRLRKKEELTKLVRVKIDMPSSLDSAWKVDVKKSQIHPPESIRKELKRIIGKIGDSGKRVYTRRGTKLRDKVSMPAWNRIASNNDIIYEINREHTLLKNFKDILSLNQFEKFKEIIATIEGAFPLDIFYSDCANALESVSRPEVKDEELNRMLDTYMTFWKIGDNPEETESLVSELMKIEPFYSNMDKTKQLLSTRGVICESEC